MLESSKFIIENRYCGLLPMFIFRKMSFKFPHLNNYSLSVIFQVKTVFCEKKWPVWWATQSYKCFSFRRSSYINKCTSRFITLNIKETCIQGLRFNNINFVASSKTFLSQAGILQMFSVWCWRIQWYSDNLASLSSFVHQH